MSAGVANGDETKDETVRESLSNEELHKMISSMIAISELQRGKKEEVKKVNAVYKAMADRVKDHMVQHKLQYVDLEGHQVHTYSRVRESPMNAEFITDGLADFLRDTKFKNFSNHKEIAEQAAAYLVTRKKDKIDGSATWTTTLRNISKKRTSAKRAREQARLLNDEGLAVGGSSSTETDMTPDTVPCVVRPNKKMRLSVDGARAVL